jgi:hypothetical protein
VSRFLGLLVIAVVAVLGMSGSAFAKVIPGQYIVVLEDGADQSDVISDHKRSAKAQVLNTRSRGMPASCHPRG